MNPKFLLPIVFAIGLSFAAYGEAPGPVPPESAPPQQEYPPQQDYYPQQQFNPWQNYFCSAACQPPSIPFPVWPMRPIYVWPPSPPVFPVPPIAPMPPIAPVPPIYPPRPVYPVHPIYPGRPGVIMPRFGGFRRMSLEGCEAVAGENGAYAVLGSNNEVLYLDSSEHAEENANAMKAYYEDSDTGLCASPVVQPSDSPIDI